jgi:delta 1-pyrroline-5-carboxylate dehydrogenase
MHAHFLVLTPAAHSVTTLRLARTMASAASAARAAALASLRTSQLFIGGKWVEAAGSMTTHDPTTGDVLAKAPAATVEDVDTAVKAAATAWKTWRWTPAEQRAKILR